MKTLVEFMDQFQFDSELALCIGAERECFLTDLEGNVIPFAKEVLDEINGSGRFGYELSACQLEERIGPCRLRTIKPELYFNENILLSAEEKLGFRRTRIEVGPENMPLDIYPDPDGRYERLVKTKPIEILRAACRVVGTHFHIGMPNHEIALRAYNYVISSYEELCKIGDKSKGERLRLYYQVAPNHKPITYKSWEDFYEYALENNFVSDPRSCWHLIRISVHGTIEFRMFGSTDDYDEILSWAKKCHNLCAEAIK